MMGQQQLPPVPEQGALETMAALSTLVASLVKDPKHGEQFLSELTKLVAEKKDAIVKLQQEVQSSEAALAAHKAELARSKQQHDAQVERDAAAFGERMKQRETELTKREVALVAREQRQEEAAAELAASRAQYEKQAAALRAAMVA
jgi:hypothetical protein